MLGTAPSVVRVKQFCHFNNNGLASLDSVCYVSCNITTHFYIVEQFVGQRVKVSTTVHRQLFPLFWKQVYQQWPDEETTKGEHCNHIHCLG